MQDLSDLADNSITATSQSAGNMTSSNRQAMTAPGSQPVSPLPPAQDQDDPNLTMSPRIPTGSTGKPATHAAAGWHPPHPSWVKAGSPGVTRAAAPAPPEVEGHAGAASIGVAGPARGATSGRGGNTST